MRIVHVTPYYAPAWAYGGVVRAVYGLAAAQAAAGHDVSVLTTDTHTPYTRLAIRREIIDRVNVVRCRNVLGLLRRINLSTPLGLGRALTELRPDVIHCHELRTVENLLILSSIVSRSVPLVVTLHGTLPQDTGRASVKRLWDRLFGPRLAHRFVRVIALTAVEADEARQWWSKFGRTPTITVIPNGVVLPELPLSRADHPPAAPTVLFLGRLHERKGVHLLIPAFAKAAVRANLPNARLLIVGPDEGMLASLQQIAAECSIADRVTFTGFLDGTQKAHVLAESDLFVLPAVGEGLPMAALEAMAAGLPVVLTPGCNLPEVELRGAGIIVSREGEALAEALTALLSDSVRRRSMAAAGQLWMREAFAWPPLAEQTIRFYQAAR